MTDDNEDEEREPLDENIRAELKEARKMKAQLQEQKDAFATLQRESAFDKAGIPEGGMGTLFRKAYDGELNKESIVKQATEFGVLQTQDTGAEAELAQLRAANAASSTGQATDVQDPGQKFLKDVAAAQSPAEIMALVATADPRLGMSIPRD